MNDSSSSRAQSVALKYSALSDAPTVVAKGYGSTAEAIIRLAKERGIYVHQSPELVDLLMKVDLDERIPPMLYAVVAELLAWLYTIESKKPDQDA